MSTITPESYDPCKTTSKGQLNLPSMTVYGNYCPESYDPCKTTSKGQLNLPSMTVYGNFWPKS